jgi:hypothetical protein
MQQQSTTNSLGCRVGVNVSLVRWTEAVEGFRGNALQHVTILEVWSSKMVAKDKCVTPGGLSSYIVMDGEGLRQALGKSFDF